MGSGQEPEDGPNTHTQFPDLLFVWNHIFFLKNWKRVRQEKQKYGMLYQEVVIHISVKFNGLGDGDPIVSFQTV